MTRSYIGLGSNLGEPLKILRSVINDLKALEEVKVTGVSSFYKTAPVGYADQPYFINAVAEIESALEPLELLHLLQSYEQKYKRVRLFKNGPRTLDLDLLIYGDTILNTDELILPHPRMCERAFVLVPLNEIAPDLVIPPTGHTAAFFLSKLTSNELSDVQKITNG